MRSIAFSFAAWENRGCWVKADRFRMEWLWSGRAENHRLGKPWVGVYKRMLSGEQKVNER